MSQNRLFQNKYCQSLFSNLSLALFGILSNVEAAYLGFLLLSRVFIPFAASMINLNRFNRSRKKVRGNLLLKIMELPFRGFSYLWTIILFAFIVLIYFSFKENSKMTLGSTFGLVILANWFYKTLKHDLVARSLEVGRPFLGFIMFVAGGTFLQNFNSNNLLVLWFFAATTIADFLLITLYKDKIEVPTII